MGSRKGKRMRIWLSLLDFFGKERERRKKKKKSRFEDRNEGPTNEIMLKKGKEIRIKDIFSGVIEIRILLSLFFSFGK